MSEDTEFRKTGSGFMMMEPRDQLKTLLREHMHDKPFSELAPVTFGHRGAALIGHIMLDTLEEQGYSIDDFDAVGALTAAAVPMVCSLMHAAASRGEDLDGFVMDFVYPAIKGPSIAGKRVILVDSWLSEKSYVVAVAALIGGVDMEEPTLKITHPVTGEAHETPFVEIFHESELH